MFCACQQCVCREFTLSLYVEDCARNARSQVKHNSRRKSERIGALCFFLHSCLSAPGAALLPSNIHSMGCVATRRGDFRRSRRWRIRGRRERVRTLAVHVYLVGTRAPFHVESRGFSTRYLQINRAVVAWSAILSIAFAKHNYPFSALFMSLLDKSNDWELILSNHTCIFITA